MTPFPSLSVPSPLRLIFLSCLRRIFAVLFRDHTEHLYNIPIQTLLMSLLLCNVHTVWRWGHGPHWMRAYHYLYDSFLKMLLDTNFFIILSLFLSWTPEALGFFWIYLLFLRHSLILQHRLTGNFHVLQSDLVSLLSQARGSWNYRHKEGILNINFTNF